MTWSNSGVVTPPGEIANSSFMKKHSVILFCSVFGFDQTPLDAIHNWGTSTPCTFDYLYPQSLWPKTSLTGSLTVWKQGIFQRLLTLICQMFQISLRISPTRCRLWALWQLRHRFYSFRKCKPNHRSHKRQHLFPIFAIICIFWHVDHTVNWKCCWNGFAMSTFQNCLTQWFSRQEARLYTNLITKPDHQNQNR